MHYKHIYAGTTTYYRGKSILHARHLGFWEKVDFREPIVYRRFQMVFEIARQNSFGLLVIR